MEKKSRTQIAEDLSTFEAIMESNPVASQRDIIEKLGISRSTLRHWMSRKDSIDGLPT